MKNLYARDSTVKIKSYGNMEQTQYTFPMEVNSKQIDIINNVFTKTRREIEFLVVQRK